ncbi:MAG: hypothetical protein KF812_05650 [Fimbriimonadaceae bacterium]|nr:hypothetical protein [Fimbriimonadaceae bacterium]
MTEMSLCHTPPPNRKLMIDKVGRELNQEHGKQKSYTQPQIQSAASNVGYPMDVHCWAMCVFMDADSFNRFHATIGEACNYDVMRGTMLQSLGLNLPFNLPQISWPDFGNVDFNFPEMSLPEITWPELDLSSFFDW